MRRHWTRFCGGIATTRRLYATRNFSALAPKNQKHVVVGMSGGVDSSVAALLLHQQGYKVTGVYMKNWDSFDEIGEQACPHDLEYQDVQNVCKQLGIEVQHVNLVQPYWNNVFSPCLDEYEEGLTPNPDILCNREIKFKAFIDHAVQIGADFVATGHYASLKRKNEDDPEAIPELFSGRDTSKDQSYFLSNVPGTAFRKVLFPLGDLLKTQVREIASKENLCTAQKKDSVGICFIGKRNFRDFITQYIPNHSGYFYSVEGHKLERHRGYSSYTIGQGARIQGQNEKFFVVGKRKQDHAVIVAAGTNHPALFSDELFVQSNKLNWISGNLPQELEVKGRMEFSYRVRYRQALGKCTVSIVTSEEALRNASALHDTPSFPPKEDDENDMTEVKQEDHPYLKVEFDIPQRGVTPQQALVLYRQDGLCYGGGPIEIPGKSYFEMNKPLDAQVFDWSR